jgi:hypothetical protein
MTVVTHPAPKFHRLGPVTLMRYSGDPPDWTLLAGRGLLYVNRREGALTVMVRDWQFTILWSRSSRLPTGMPGLVQSSPLDDPIVTETEWREQHGEP